MAVCRILSAKMSRRGRQRTLPRCQIIVCRPPSETVTRNCSGKFIFSRLHFRACRDHWMTRSMAAVRLVLDPNVPRLHVGKMWYRSTVLCLVVLQYTNDACRHSNSVSQSLMCPKFECHMSYHTRLFCCMIKILKLDFFSKISKLRNFPA